MFAKNYKRVIYEKNPLADVSCHFLFPPILKIETEIPADFQESLREQFPLYERQVESEVSERLAASLPRDISTKLSSTTHYFQTAEEDCTVVLDRHSLTIKTDSYKTWTQFKEVWTSPLESFSEIYKPKFFSYVGLRYLDRIDKAEIGIDKETPWSELIQPYVLGELGTTDLDESNVLTFENKILVEVDDIKGLLGVQHGLLEQADTEDRVYIIDGTFFTKERTEISDAEKILDTFNQKAGSFFRWCITETLHCAMQPKDK